MSPTQQVSLPDGGHLNARIDGPEGAPWLVFSNSVLTDLSIWEAQVAALTDRYRVLRYDQRGHGASSHPAGPMSFDDYGADLIALLDACGVERCGFVGLSMGVPTGLAALAISPDRFTLFVAVDGVAKSAAGRAAFWTERRATAQADGMDRIAEQTAPRWLPGALPDEACTSALTRMISGTATAGFAATTHALEAYDYSGTLEGLTLPFLGIAGEKDGAMPDAMRRQFAALPQAQFAVIEGAGHVPNLQNPSAFNTRLRPFLDAQQQTKEAL